MNMAGDELYDDDVTSGPWNDIEQGRWDDDPNPYDGNYSED